MSFLDTLAPQNTQPQQGGFLGSLGQSQGGVLPKPQMPILTNEQGGFGTALKDVAVGAGKDLIGTARDTAGLLQSGGKMALGALDFDKSKLGLDSLDNSTPTGKGVQDTLNAKSRGEQTGKVLSGVTQLVAPLAGGNAEKLIAKGKAAYEGYQAGKEAKAATEATSKITEMISPKATVKEAKIAQTQGRLLEGKQPTLLRAGTEDKILPSKKTLSSAETIAKSIPNASKMSEGELYKAVDENISKTAKALRPQLEQTPIEPETVSKINKDWEELRTKQLADAPATEEANVAKRQAKFESLLQKTNKNSVSDIVEKVRNGEIDMPTFQKRMEERISTIESASHADLWDTAIDYDKSISDSVKKATSLSPESMQLQKQEWLDNRKILSDAIDKTGKPEFKQMSDMYNAKEGILSKAKVDKAQMSKVNQFLKDNPKVAAGLGGATMYEIAKHLGIPLP